MTGDSLKMDEYPAYSELACLGDTARGSRHRMKESVMSFRDGFLDGWRSVKGQNAATPSIPSTPPIPPGRTLYQLGWAKGVERAKGG
jgi:hypothetical protein